MLQVARCALFVLWLVLVGQLIVSMLVTAPPPQPETSPAPHPQPVLHPHLDYLDPELDHLDPELEPQMPAQISPQTTEPHPQPPLQSPQPAAGVECEGGVCRPGFRLFRGLFRR
jgi:hypothetical protein